MSSQKRLYGYRFGLDPVTGQSLHHISFLLRHFMPLEFIHDETQKRMIECDLFDANRSWGFPKYPGQKHSILTGSLSEGLGVPDYHWVSAEGYLHRFVVSRDKDEMIFEENWYKENLPEEAHACQEGPLFELEKIPGKPESYARLRISKVYRMAREAMGNPVQTTYLDNETVKESLLATYQNNDVYPKHLGLPVEVHGPSVTLLSPDHSSLERDLCLGIHFNEWPEVAREWPARKRKSGWPSHALVDMVMQKGHFMVPVGMSGSQDDNLQWRYSFSTAEKLLARSLRPLVRKAYIIIKLLHSFYLKDPGVLPTYCLKSLLFWHCEKHQTLLWQEEDLASIVFCLLDEIQHSLVRGEVPHYFFPNVNLLMIAPRDCLHTLAKKVRHLRANLLSYLCKIIKEVHFVDLPLRVHFMSVSCSFMKNTREKPLDTKAFRNDMEDVLFEFVDSLVGILKVQEVQLSERPNANIELMCQCTRFRVVRILGSVWKEMMGIAQNIEENNLIIFILLRLCLLRDDDLLLAKTFMWCFAEYMGFKNAPTLDSLRDEVCHVFNTGELVCQRSRQITCGKTRRSQEEVVARLRKMKQCIMEGNVPILVFAGDNAERQMMYLRSTAPPPRATSGFAHMSVLASQLTDQLVDIIPGLELPQTRRTNSPMDILQQLMQQYLEKSSFK